MALPKIRQADLLSITRFLCLALGKENPVALYKIDETI